jgi:hypothetical protein
LFTLSACDAVSVALAEVLEATLLTCDARLARASHAARRVELVNRRFDAVSRLACESPRSHSSRPQPVSGLDRVISVTKVVRISAAVRSQLSEGSAARS